MNFGLFFWHFFDLFVCRWVQCTLNERFGAKIVIIFLNCVLYSTTNVAGDKSSVLRCAAYMVSFLWCNKIVNQTFFMWKLFSRIFFFIAKKQQIWVLSTKNQNWKWGLNICEKLFTSFEQLFSADICAVCFQTRSKTLDNLLGITTILIDTDGNLLKVVVSQ